jgi:hypothetical protein
MDFVLNLVLDAINKSKQLLLLAQESKWEDFVIADAERQALLLNLDLTTLELSEEENDKLHSQMSELLLLNKELELICEKQRANIAKELKQFKKKNNVAKAYSQ